MTTRITVKNDGPDCLLVRFYKEDRQFSDEELILKVGESQEITIWNGKLPVMWPIGADGKGGNNFYAVPPATYAAERSALPAPAQVGLPEVIGFLLGECALDGAWFGDPHGSGKPCWWRTPLRAAAEQIGALRGEVEIYQKVLRAGRLACELAGEQRAAAKSRAESLQRELMQLATKHDELTMELAELRARSEWIPVGERLPEQNGLYLTVIQPIIGESFVRAQSYEKQEHSGLAGWRYARVTDWQPLPLTPNATALQPAARGGEST